jgi:hypothetical protein
LFGTFPAIAIDGVPHRRRCCSLLRVEGVP